MNEISSPCILVCSIDLKSGYCFGCGRTSDEITSWINFSETQRTQIMATLDDRLAKLERKPRRITKRRRMKQTATADIGSSQL